MATKAQIFRAQQQREANPPKPKKPRPPRRDLVVDTSRPGVSASHRKAGQGSSGARNLSKRAAKKGGARLEDSATGRASRKSTRKSAGRMKHSGSLERRAIRLAHSGKTQAAKARR